MTQVRHSGLVRAPVKRGNAVPSVSWPHHNWLLLGYEILSVKLMADQVSDYKGGNDQSCGLRGEGDNHNATEEQSKSRPKVQESGRRSLKPQTLSLAQWSRHRSVKSRVAHPGSYHNKARRLSSEGMGLPLIATEVKHLKRIEAEQLLSKHASINQQSTPTT